jgi:hypothetical protein
MSRVALALLVIAAGCKLGDSYHCARDSQCANGAARGTCEPTGFCSFDDANCASGHRYGRWAPAPLGSACVEPVVDLGAADLACGDDLEPCCGGSSCNGGLTCGNGTCFFFFDGFDGAISSSWYQRAENGSMLAVDTKAYRGSGSLKITANSGSASFEEVDLERPASQSPLYARAFVWMPSTATLSTSSHAQLMTYHDSTDSPFPLAALGLSSTFRVAADVQDWNSTPISASAAAAMPLDTWVCLEWTVRWDGTPTVAVAQNDLPAAAIAPSPLANPLNVWSIGFAGAPPGSALTFWIDEVALDTHPIGCQR